MLLPKYCFFKQLNFSTFSVLRTTKGLQPYVGVSNFLGGTSCLYLHAIRCRSGGDQSPHTLNSWPGGTSPPSPPTPTCVYNKFLFPRNISGYFAFFETLYCVNVPSWNIAGTRVRVLCFSIIVEYNKCDCDLRLIISSLFVKCAKMSNDKIQSI